MLKKKNLNTLDALLAAASKGCLAAVRFLVEEGVSKTDTDEKGRTPLMLATQNVHLPIMQFLEEEQQPSYKDNDDRLLTKKKCNIQNALRAAAKRGDVETVRFLVEEGVRKDKANEKGWTHLMHASQGVVDTWEWSGISSYLVEQGADKDKALNNDASPLYVAAEQGHLEVVQYLVEIGADKEKAADDGIAPLHAAAFFGHLGVVQYLIELGVDKDKADNDGWTALLLAAEQGHVEVVEHLLQHDSDVDKTRGNGWSPLHAAAHSDHAEVVTCLMNWAAPLTARTTDGQLPIDVADNEAIKQLIRDEEDRRRNHGYKRAVIPNPTASEQAASKRARLEEGEEEDEEGREDEGGGQGQAQASSMAMEEEDDGENDDSASSDEDHE